MQLVPDIADRVASVTVYQRTAQWARRSRTERPPISDGAQWLLAHLPFYVQWYRFNSSGAMANGLLRSCAGSRLAASRSRRQQATTPSRGS